MHSSRIVLLFGLMPWLVNSADVAQPPPGVERSRWEDSMQDTEHLREHLKDKVNIDTSEMSQEERTYHYFKEHDTDNNNFLDGLEIIKATMHMMEFHHNQKTEFNLKSTEQMVDNILDSRDLNKDGYLSYPEIARKINE